MKAKNAPETTGRPNEISFIFQPQKKNKKKMPFKRAKPIPLAQFCNATRKASATATFSWHARPFFDQLEPNADTFGRFINQLTRKASYGQRKKQFLAKKKTKISTIVTNHD